MACARYSGALSAAAAGGKLPQGFDVHLAGCAKCRAELVLLQRGLAMLDQDLQQLSTAGPSAGFVPRVRAAVMESAAVPAWRAGWLWPSMATAVALVMAFIVIVANRVADETIVAGGKQPSASATTPEPGAAQAPARVHTPALAHAPEKNDRTTLQTHRRTSRPGGPAKPQVLVPPGESRALMEFIALVNRERLTPAALNAAGQPLASLAAVRPIEIKPIEIVPLDPVMNPGT